MPILSSVRIATAAVVEADAFGTFEDPDRFPPDTRIFAASMPLDTPAVPERCDAAQTWPSGSDRQDRTVRIGPSGASRARTCNQGGTTQE